MAQDGRLRSTHEWVRGICQMCGRSMGSPHARHPCTGASTGGRPGRMITANGQTLSVSGWARLLGCRDTTISERLRAGWDEAAAVTTPIGPAQRPSAELSARVRRENVTPTALLRSAGYHVESMPVAGGWVLLVRREGAKAQEPEAAE